MNVKARIVLMSHLSDIDCGVSMNVNNLPGYVRLRTEFCKYIILKTNGDLNVEINPDEMFEAFLNRSLNEVRI